MTDRSPITTGGADFNADPDRTRLAAFLAVPPLQGVGPGCFVGLVQIVQNGVGFALDIHKPVSPRCEQRRHLERRSDWRSGGDCHAQTPSHGSTMAAMPGWKPSQRRQSPQVCANVGATPIHQCSHIDGPHHWSRDRQVEPTRFHHHNPDNGVGHSDGQTH